MKKIFCLALCFALLCGTLFSCKLTPAPEEPSVSPPQQDEPETPPSPDAFYETDALSDQQTYTDGDTVVLETDFALIHLPGTSENCENVNAYYENLLEKQRLYAEEELLPEARTYFEETQQNDAFTFSPYSLSITSTVSLNTEPYFSVVREIYSNTGGAHPNTELASETFSMSNGGQMNLSDVFSVPDTEYLPVLFKAIRTEILSPDFAMPPSDLYEDYDALIEQVFDPQHFYLTPDALVIYYNAYDIAPYAAGIFRFEIPYTALSDILNLDRGEISSQ